MALNALLADHYAFLAQAATRLLSQGQPTPFLLFDTDRLRANIALFRAVPAPSTAVIRVYLATKACYLPGLLELLLGDVDGFDVQSRREADLCPPGARIAYHSALFDPELVADPRLDRVSFNTRAQAERYAASLLHKASGDLDVGFRLAVPRIGEDRGVPQPGRFGMPIADVLALGRRNWPGRLFLHHHSHSRLNDLDEAAVVADLFADWAARVSGAAGPLRSVNLGGGWDGMFELRVREVALNEILRRQLAPLASLSELDEVILEPGRAVFEDAAMLVCRVKEIIQAKGTTYAITDACHGYLTPGRQSRYRVLPLEVCRTGPVHYTVSDGTCSPRGVLAGQWLGGRLEEGQPIGLVNCGAYSTSLANEFFCPHPPALALLGGGELRPLRRPCWEDGR
ncbi:hypothetical protein [uncultured Lamprocystis sp.]|jgi:diaminopimelate decarboxylase|uniref:hypothetical protein n=1 Tax=uncultured Lamprocystis sp. TaxID=543132 RepID=UPI0025EA3387|nr:hypothetical protein [uncultured Lamprocystis sp.]